MKMNIIPSYSNNQICSAPKSIYFKGNAEKRLISELSKNLYQSAVRDFNSNRDILESILPKGCGELTGRVKKQNLIEEILNYKTDKLGFERVVEDSKEMIPDRFGFRFIMNNFSEKNADKLVTAIEAAVYEGKMTPCYFVLHGSKPYINKSMITRLQKLGFRRSNPKADTGYHGVHLYYKNQNGDKVELQVMGSQMAALAAKEHPILNFFARGKATKQEEVLTDLDTALRRLKENEIKEFKAYKKACFNYTRDTEKGESVQKPQLPKIFREILRLV